MLELHKISKQYTTGALVQKALDGVDLAFRKSEFVAVLGPSGSGKTTLLNIIGGLDRYDSGDLVINSVSTKKYSDRDWDTYRNHMIGFVFQNYNLIPHQSILSNVELALTISGVSRAERRRRAKEALRSVGLGDQLHKRPNQMSGGQMQRVAIARALVNDPDVLLADEPTGALDSETSVHVMDLLKEVAKDRLVIMVTHNGELANEYANRIVKLKDGRIIDDSNPFDPREESKAEPKPKKNRSGKKTSMGFLTAISLSLNNLRTKKGRTILTAFAGSIGIIGISMILALSTGIHNYVDDIQKETLVSYPIVVEKEPNNMLKSFASMREKDDSAQEHEADKVYTNPRIYKMFNAAFTGTDEQNNLAPFKTYIEKRFSDSKELSDLVNAVHYDYGLKLTVYFKDSEGNYKNADISQAIFGSGSEEESTGMGMFNMVSSRMPNMNLWSELIPGRNGELIDPMIFDQYDLVAGEWPKETGDIVLIMTNRQEITDNAFYALGLTDEQDIKDMLKAVLRGEKLEETSRSASFDEILGKEFKLILACEKYRKLDDGGTKWEDISEDDAAMNLVIKNGLDLRVVGIIKPNTDNALSFTGAFGYTSKLSDYVISKTEEKELIKLQSAAENENLDLITGLPFVITDEGELTDAEKSTEVREYFASLKEGEKVEIYTKILGMPDEAELASVIDGYLAMYPTRESMIGFAAESYGFNVSDMEEYLSEYSDDEIRALMREQISALLKANAEESAKMQVMQMVRELSDPDDLLGVSGYHAVAAAFDQMIAVETDQSKLAAYYDAFMPTSVAGVTLSERLAELGYVDRGSPDSISIYVSSFDDKETVTKLIDDYNGSVRDEEDKIEYTDYVALLMSGVTTIIDAVTYGLIAFVTISLIVSSIMIGIITYISVLERTKEIGILRSIGASKRNIRSVFNAETLIIGFFAGIIGIGVTVLLCIPLNLILHKLTGIETLSAVLPVRAAVILVLISMMLTLISGLIPAGIAARKDPVTALRTE